MEDQDAAIKTLQIKGNPWFAESLEVMEGAHLAGSQGSETGIIFMLTSSAVLGLTSCSQARCRLMFSVWRHWRLRLTLCNVLQKMHCDDQDRVLKEVCVC